MDCTSTRKRLSAYHDRELPAALVADVTGHCEYCVDCRSTLVGFRRLSILAARLVDPTPPSGQWSDIHRRIRSPAASEAFSVRCGTSVWRGSNLTLAAIAALLLIAISVGVLSYRLDILHSDSAVAADFQQYLDTYESNHPLAQQTLLANYQGRAVDLAEATRQVGYEPFAAKNLPAGYAVNGIYVLDMPCCTCAQIVWTRADGGVVTIFEHEEDEPAWFGGRPTIETCLYDSPAKLVQVGEMLAVTWKRGVRHVTVIGAQDVEEVTQLLSASGETDVAT